MIDLIAVWMDIFLIFLIIIVLAVGLKLIYAIFNANIPKSNYGKIEKHEIEQNLKEDSEGDGLVLFNDPLFPEEPKDE
jgi:hypothetical protein